VRPQAVWTASVLLAVTGPSTKLHFGPPRLASRNRSNVSRSSHQARISSSRAG
jgi:hypothetical protein